jgi:hypothetical protein
MIPDHIQHSLAVLRRAALANMASTEIRRAIQDLQAYAEGAESQSWQGTYAQRFNDRGLRKPALGQPEPRISRRAEIENAAWDRLVRARRVAVAAWDSHYLGLYEDPNI